MPRGAVVSDRVGRDNGRVLASFLLRAAWLIRAHPLGRIALGLLVIAGGALAVAFGSGHGGLIALGAVLVAGGVAAIRGGGRRTAGHDRRKGDDPHADDKSDGRER